MAENTVIAAVIKQCLLAFYAHTPFIMIETDDRELIKEVVLKLYDDKEIVGLVPRGTRDGNLELSSYYEFFETVDPDGLYITDLDSLMMPLHEKFKDDIKEGRRLFGVYLGKSTAGSNKVVGSKKVVGSNKVVAPSDIIQVLREYRNAFLDEKTNSALRNTMVLLYGDPSLLTEDIDLYTSRVTIPYPVLSEIAEKVRKADEWKSLDSDTIQLIAEQMKGMTLTSIRQTLDILTGNTEDNQILLYNGKIRKKIILEQKEQILRKKGAPLDIKHDDEDSEHDDEDSEYDDEDSEYDDEDSDSNAAGGKNSRKQGELGGMRAYKKWIRRHLARITNPQSAMRNGMNRMKGILLCGVPGCGKSLAGKLLRKITGLTMVTMEMGKLMGGLVGDSEKLLMKAMAQAEAMAPCILFIDEFDKAFAAARKNGNTNDTYERMIGMLLKWLQDNEESVFLFATANDISLLPDEFVRPGRFDALFGVYMPTAEECKDIFTKKMKNVNKRRKKKLEEEGRIDQYREILSDDVIRKSCNVVMDYFSKDKSPEEPEAYRFVTGADIETIVDQALMIAEKKRKNKFQDTPFSLDEWNSALAEVITDPELITSGSSSAQLNSIAACYVQLMRGPFRNCASKPQRLFSREHYKVKKTFKEDGKPEVTVDYDGECQLKSPYDKALFNALKEIIIGIGGMIEITDLERKGGRR